MGTLAGHILPGALLIALAISHLLRSISSHSKSPREFSARIWHPIRRPRHLELHLLLAALLISLIYHSTIALASPSLTLIPLQRTALILAFFIATLIILLSDALKALTLPPPAPFLLASVCFALEWIILSQDYIRQLGLEGRCDSIQANLALACSILCGLLSWSPNLFLADVALCDGLLLQGSWLVQTGLTLYVKRFVPRGCGRELHLPVGMEGSTRCDLEEARARAFALLDLLLLCHVVGVMVFTSAAYCAVQRRAGAAGYELVDVEGNSGGVPMKAMPKQAQF